MTTNVYFGARRDEECNTIRITLNDSAIAKLFDEAFKGWCIACNNNRVDEDELICCKCLSQAIKCHYEAGCCSEANDEQEEAERQQIIDEQIKKTVKVVSLCSL